MDKIFIGKVKTEQKTGRNGDWEETRISFGPKDFELLEQHKNKGWVNLLLRRSQAGKDYMEVDTWVPVKGEDYQRPSGNGQLPEVQYGDSMPPVPQPPPMDDLPF